MLFTFELKIAHTTTFSKRIVYVTACGSGEARSIGKQYGFIVERIRRVNGNQPGIRILNEMPVPDEADG